MMIEIIKTVFVICGLIAAYWTGIIIGREYGTFEKFSVAILDRLNKRIKGESRDERP